MTPLRLFLPLSALALLASLPLSPAAATVIPAPGAISANPFPGFRWAAHAEAFRDVAHPVEYEVRISREKAGKVEVVDEDRVALNRYVPDQALAPGNYRWQVRLHHRGQAGAWSEATVFTIREAERVLQVDAAKGLVEGFTKGRDPFDRGDPRPGEVPHGSRQAAPGSDGCPAALLQEGLAAARDRGVSAEAGVWIPAWQGIDG